MFVADFCMNPSGNILSILGSGQVYNVFNYYLTCSGSSPFTPYINDLQTYIVGRSFEMTHICILADSLSRIL